MKIDNAALITDKQVGKPPKKHLSDEVRAKLESKFGKEIALKKAAKKARETEISDRAKARKEKKDARLAKAKMAEGSEYVKEVAGDIGVNNPKSEMTQVKLKGLLNSGGFNFTDKERATLGKILDK